MRIYVISIGCNFVGCQNFNSGGQSGSERNAHCSRKAGRELGGGVVSGEVPAVLHSVSISNDLYRSGRSCYELGRDARSWRKERGAEALLGLRLRTLTTFERHLALRPDFGEQGGYGIPAFGRCCNELTLTESGDHDVLAGIAPQDGV